MDGPELQERAATRTGELPGSELTHPFGEDWEVWKVRGKVFMLQTDVTGEPIVIIKAAPADGEALRSAHPEITPGYHMNKKHWITVNPGGTVDPELLDDLVTESFLLGGEGVPKREPPGVPQTFGQRG